MLKVGQIERTEITGYSSEGMGVCRVDGCAVFVPNAIRGELCTVKITHVSRSSAHGKIEEILKRSPHRISRSCPVAKLCGGCQYHHMDYQEELYAKARKVTDALNRLGGQSLQTVTITGGDGTRWETQGTGNREHGTGNREHGTGTEETDSSTALRSAQNDGSEGSDSLISPVNAGGNAAAVPAAEASGDASLRGEPVPAAVYAYRNKAQYPVSERNGKPVAGFYKNRTHEVIPVARCAILPEIFDQVRDVVIRWAEEDRVSVYDERTGRGLLRHIYVRRGAVSGQVMVCLAVNGERLPREKRLVHALQREIPGLSSVVLSVNTKNTNVVLGDSFRTLWGRDWIEDELCGFTFRLSPRSFYQVNHDQAQRLYEKAVELAELHGTETVLDLYCGTGTITLALSRKAGKVVGVEVVPEAIEDAKENAARNGVENVEFFCADAAAAAERFAALAAGNREQATGENTVGADAHIGPAGPDDAAGNGQQASGDGRERILRSAQNDRIETVDVIVVDPPRKGLAPDVIEAMVQMFPARIVYVSCDPATLARDVKLLTDRGYALTHAEAFDLFPRTFHVETVVQLVRKNPDMTVSVTLNLEDADLTASEAMATYEQIKAYVLETYGLRVTSLQIAQTKHKLGLPTGEHYNLSQKEDQIIPNCPPEKESAIREALRHFRMV